MDARPIALRAGLVVAICGAMCRAAAADVVAYDTFGDNDSYLDTMFYPVLPSGPTFGFVFEAQATGAIEEIVLAIGGRGNFRAELLTVDADGLPDVSLGSWVAAASNAVPLTYALMPRITPENGPVLESGESYALVVHTASSLTPRWFLGRNIGANMLPLVERDAAGNWTSNMRDATGFRVIVPAPGSLAVIAGIAAISRRRAR